eukprot:m.17840 g.17840  ORF g.17840 m.17840 type:complete len:682 (-) comp4845_c0_seq1:2039-4084(-)
MLTSLLIVALVGVVASGAPLNENIQHYESISIPMEDVMRPGRYVRSMFRHDKPFSFSVKAFDKDFTFNMQPDTELFSDHMEIAAFNGEERTEVFLNDRTYYKGSVNGNSSEFCHFRVANDGTIHGMFNYDGERYKVDPATYHDINEEDVSLNHVVYRLSDHKNADLNIPAHCGVKDVENDFADVRDRRAGVPFILGMTVCDVAFVADSLFFNAIGAGDLSRTIDIMTTRFANVKEVYETTNDITDAGTGTKISIRIGYFEIQQDSNNDPYNPVDFGGNGENYLKQVSSDPNTANGVTWEQFCIVHMLTYQDFDSGLLGLAWVGTTGSSPGGICQQAANLGGTVYTTNTGFSTQINFGVDVPELTVYLVMAHEMGHNFGSNHDATDATHNVMYPVSVDGSSSVNFEFSAQSLSSISAVIQAKGGCFISPSEPSCGNGVQEGVEPCDCGTDVSLCAQIDTCCAPNCALAMGAACSPHHSDNGVCCSSGCNKITSGECRPESQCTLSSNCNAQGECVSGGDKADWTSCTTTTSKVCNAGTCDTSVCEAWGLTQNDTVLGTCVIYCGDMNTAQLGMPANPPINSTGFPIDLSAPLIKAPGETCLVNALTAGVCSDTGLCIEADQNVFDSIRNFLNSFSLDALKDWFFRTDAILPNYGWLAIGLGLLILLITLCCCVSNKMDKKIT